ncbi:MAG: hypothetical protein ACRDNC_04020 [Gaiellaceae bacterium]
MAVRVFRAARLRRVALGSPFPLVLGLYALVAVAATWPGVRSFTDSFIANGADGHGEAAAGDHLQAVYRFWLAGHQLGRGEAPWVDPYSFQPLVEPQTVLGAWPFALPFWPLEVLAGPVVAWNLVLVGTIVAAGLLTYWWLRALDIGTAGAFVGGLAFALAPYRLAQSSVHLLGWIAVLLPLALLAIERARTAESRRAAHAWGALAALALVSVPLSGQVHLALGAIPFALAYALVRFGRIPLAWAAGGAAAAVGIGLVIRYTLIAGSAEEGGRSLQEVGEFSAEWSDLLSRWQLGGLEDFVYLGWLTPVLAVVGAVILWRAGHRGLASLLGLAAVLPPLLALGTNLPFYSWLWQALPPLRYPRVPGRILPIADLALAGLAGIAVARAVWLAGRRAAAAAAALAVLVAADLLVLPFAATPADPGNDAYAALRAEPRGRLLELPLVEPGIHYGSVHDYYALQAPRERLSGYSTLVAQPAFDFYFVHNRLSCGVWLPGDEDALLAAGVESVAFHRGLYAAAEIPGAWFGWRGLLEHDFAPHTTGGAITLFTRGDPGGSTPTFQEPSRAQPVLCQGWRERTMEERQGPLWVFGAGRLELRVSTPARLEAGLWVDGERLPDVIVSDEATLRTELEGERWHAVVVEVPELLPADPPRGLRLESITLGR